MSNIFEKKLSPILQEFLPEFVKADHPKFVKFLKDYYRFLESGQLVLSGTVNYVLQETASTNYISSEIDGERVVLEDSLAKFVVGETIIGLTSGATATILVDDFDNSQTLYITSQQQFITGESVRGSSSGSRATVSSYRANPIQNIQQLLDYADVDHTIYDFLDRFRDSFLEGIPDTLATGLSKRKLIKNIKELYTKKGTVDGHKLFFRMLFDEEIEVIFPRDNLLRPSDGTWNTEPILRVTISGNVNFSNAENQIVTGLSSGVQGRITIVTNFQEGGESFAQLSMAEGSLTGTFTVGETVSTTDIINDVTITGVVKEILTGVNLLENGQYYEPGDPINVIGGNNFGDMEVFKTSEGEIDEVIIDSGGSGYRPGVNVTVNNDDTNGKNFAAEVEVVGGSLELEHATAPELLRMNSDETIKVNSPGNIELEDATFENINIVLDGTDSLGTDAGDNIITNTFYRYFPTTPKRQFGFGSVGFAPNLDVGEDMDWSIDTLDLDGTDSARTDEGSVVILEDSLDNGQILIDQEEDYVEIEFPVFQRGFLSLFIIFFLFRFGSRFGEPKFIKRTVRTRFSFFKMIHHAFGYDGHTNRGVLLDEETFSEQQKRLSISEVDKANDLILEDSLGNFNVLREEPSLFDLSLEQDPTIDHIILEGTTAASADEGDFLIQEDSLENELVQLEQSECPDILRLETNEPTELETATLPTQERGEITRIKITNEGNGYTKLPVLSMLPFVKTISSNNVSTVTNTIQLNNHGYVTGDIVIYNNNSGISIGGLTDGTTYFVIRVNDNFIKLASTQKDSVQFNIVLNGTNSGSANEGEDIIVVTEDGEGSLVDEESEFNINFTTTGNNAQTLTSGSGADLIAKSNSGVGAVSQVKIKEFGADYRNETIRIVLEEATVASDRLSGNHILIENEGEGDSLIDEDTQVDSVRFNKNVLVKDVIGTFTATEGLTSSDGTVVSFDSTRKIIKINSTHTPNEDERISTANASATVVQCLNAEGILETGSVGNTTGEFIGSKGFISEDQMRIQDSYYYQDFSYVIKIGESINEWRDSIKTATHPAGFQVFGQVVSATRIYGGVTIPTGSEISGYIGDTETFTPELASTFTNIFTAVFGRRLGTTTDGTTLNTSPNIGYEENASMGTTLPSGKRELTLSSDVTVSMGGTNATVQATAPFLINLAKYGFMQEGFLEDDENIHAYYTIDQFKDFTFSDVSVTGGFSDTDEEKFDSTTRTFDEIANNGFADGATTTRINVPPRGEIRVRKTGAHQAFDMDYTTFDSIRHTFDEGTGTGRDTLGTEFTDFSEIGHTFDSTSFKFDEGIAGITNPLDFSQDNYTFDDTLGGPFARFDTAFSTDQIADVTTTFDASEFKFDSTLTINGLTFDTTAS